MFIGLFAASVYASIIITNDGEATIFLKFAVYLFTIILGIFLNILKRGVRGKFYFIMKLTTGEFKIFEPLTLKSEILDKKMIKGYSKSSENSIRRFIRLYFKTRDDITFLTYYWNFGKLEQKLQNEEIEFLGLEKFEYDMWGTPTGQKY